MVDATTESIVALEQTLGVWSQRSTGLWAQAAAHLRGSVAAIEDELRQRATKVRALEALRASASEEDLPRIEAELAAARLLLQKAERARSLAFGAAQQFEAARRRSAAALEPVLHQARGDLKRRLNHLDGYAVRGVAGPSGGGGGTPSGGSPLPGALASLGMQLVDLTTVDFSDNPIVGKFGQGGAELADYRWAVETWDTVVGPGVARNQGRDDFAARDAERGAAPFRRTADVYDLFLGDSPIALSRRPDGTYNVVVGRHRIQVARQLGIDSLPARILP